MPNASLCQLPEFPKRAREGKQLSHARLTTDVTYNNTGARYSTATISHK